MAEPTSTTVDISEEPPVQPQQPLAPPGEDSVSFSGIGGIEPEPGHLTVPPPLPLQTDPDQHDHEGEGHDQQLPSPRLFDPDVDWIDVASDEVLRSHLKEALQHLRDKDRDLTIAAEIGQHLLEANNALKSAYQDILKRSAPASTLPLPSADEVLRASLSHVNPFEHIAPAEGSFIANKFSNALVTAVETPSPSFSNHGNEAGGHHSVPTSPTWAPSEEPEYFSGDGEVEAAPFSPYSPTLTAGILAGGGSGVGIGVGAGASTSAIVGRTRSPSARAAAPPKLASIRAAATVLSEEQTTTQLTQATPATAATSDNTDTFDAAHGAPTSPTHIHAPKSIVSSPTSMGPSPANRTRARAQSRSKQHRSPNASLSPTLRSASLSFDLTDYVASLERANADLQVQLRASKMRFRDAQQAHARNVARLEGDIEDLRVELANAENKLKGLEGEKQRWLKERLAHRRERSSLELNDAEVIGDLNRRIRASDEETTRLLSVKRDLERRLEVTLNALQQAEGRCVELEDKMLENTILQDINEKQTRHIEELQEQLEEHRLRLQALSSAEMLEDAFHAHGAISPSPTSIQHRIDGQSDTFGEKSERASSFKQDTKSNAPSSHPKAQIQASSVTSNTVPPAARTQFYPSLLTSPLVFATNPLQNVLAAAGKVPLVNTLTSSFGNASASTAKPPSASSSVPSSTTSHVASSSASVTGSHPHFFGDITSGDAGGAQIYDRVAGSRRGSSTGFSPVPPPSLMLAPLGLQNSTESGGVVGGMVGAAPVTALRDRQKPAWRRASVPVQPSQSPMPPLSESDGEEIIHIGPDRSGNRGKTTRRAKHRSLHSELGPYLSTFSGSAGGDGGNYSYQIPIKGGDGGHASEEEDDEYCDAEFSPGAVSRRSSTDPTQFYMALENEFGLVEHPESGATATSSGVVPPPRPPSEGSVSSVVIHEEEDEVEEPMPTAPPGAWTVSIPPIIQQPVKANTAATAAVPLKASSTSTTLLPPPLKVGDDNVHHTSPSNLRRKSAIPLTTTKKATHGSAHTRSKSTSTTTATKRGRSNSTGASSINNSAGAIYYRGGFGPANPGQIMRMLIQMWLRLLYGLVPSGARMMLSEVVGGSGKRRSSVSAAEAGNAKGRK
ncbi:hypothetical protein HK102_001795 [Quaeritorhiza haematococci]|nr:hypothetical protein HK102_001795 [Quaeritorhiza haematococci]